jgi:hypothetical protein
MPLDDFFSYRKDRVYWKYTRCLWPRKSSISGKWIWWRHAYKGVLILHGPGDPVYITHWLTTDEFLLSRLRGTL